MPLRKFELLSLVSRKHKNEPPAPPPSSALPSQPPPLDQRSNHPSPSYQPGGGIFQSNFRSTTSSTSSLPPPPPTPAQEGRDGFYSSVQYERLTPSVSQRPPLIGSTSSTSSSTRSLHPHSSTSVSSSTPSVHYERLVPSATSSASTTRHPSPQAVQYERLTASSTSPHVLRSPVTYHQQHSPSIPALHGTTRPQPLGSNAPSPVDVDLASPLQSADHAIPRPRVALDRRPPRASSGSSLPTVAEDASVAGTPGDGSDKSTPFSIVMEEWMSQLRTPTPDVMLLPSPYDFNQNTPTPVEKMEDIRRIHDALLPTPPPDVHDQKQGTKSSEYVLSAGSNGRRPLVEDIASLCRDLISQEVADQLAKRLLTSLAQAGGDPAIAAARLGAKPPVAPTPSTNNYHARKASITSDGQNSTAVSPSVEGENDDDDVSSVSGSTQKGKRRKMCTAEGCQNLSRSRGLCKAHGGGRRCSVEGCSRASQSGSLCITHGGGKRCTVDGCQKAAQSRGMCKAHGGGVRCRVDGCTKSSQGDGYCRTHGGGRRCGHPDGCTKWAQRNGMCMAHSEGRYGNSYRGRLARMQAENNGGHTYPDEDDE